MFILKYYSLNHMHVIFSSVFLLFLPSLIAFMAENNAWLLGQRAANGLLGLNQQTLLRVYTLLLRG